MSKYNIAILGAGPAGLSAALQLKRQGQRPLLLEGKRPGGLLLNANLVENYPGFPEGISGPDLVESFLTQVDRWGVEITHRKVRSLDFKEDLFTIQTEQDVFQSEIVIVATGTEPKVFRDVLIPEEAAGLVFYEVFPIQQVRGKTILIIGAGDAALDYALNLADANQVLILNRSRKRKGLKLLWERVQKETSIRYYDRHIVRSIQFTDSQSLKIRAVSEGEERTFDCDFLIPAIGRTPALDFLSPTVKDEVKSLSDMGRLFFIGDVKNREFRQTAIAVGDGLKAAMKIDQILDGG
ncbi:MAG: NAD(P)/FAD-dependent oxidoreductase [Anaerolineales bacterium]